MAQMVRNHAWVFGTRAACWASFGVSYRSGLLARRLLVLSFAVCVLIAGSGCFSERSFPMRPDQITHLPANQHFATRQWAVAAHKACADLLPETPAITTDDLSRNGIP